MFLVTQCTPPPHIDNAISVLDAANQVLYYSCNVGYWISPGVFNSSSSTCNASGDWNPNPLTTIACDCNSLKL